MALSGLTRNYAAYELEMNAVVRAVKHVRMFLLKREFLLQTDYAALAKLLRRDLLTSTSRAFDISAVGLHVPHSASAWDRQRNYGRALEAAVRVCSCEV